MRTFSDLGAQHQRKEPGARVAICGEREYRDNLHDVLPDTNDACWTCYLRDDARFLKSAETTIEGESK